MRVLKNVLSEHILREVEREREEFKQLRVWGSSQLDWPENIMVGVKGDCSFAYASQGLSNAVRHHLSSVLPSHRKFFCQHYIWKEDGAISWHFDGTYVFGMTVYLNPQWHPNYGGIFLYQGDGELKALCPEYNSAVLNVAKTGHMVTPVTRAAPTHRYTLQIWGEN